MYVYREGKEREKEEGKGGRKDDLKGNGRRKEEELGC